MSHPQGFLDDSHSDIATRKTIALQLSKQWIPTFTIRLPGSQHSYLPVFKAKSPNSHFFLSLLCPPTSNSLYVRSPMTKVVSLIPVVLTRARKMSWSVGVKLVAPIRPIELK